MNKQLPFIMFFIALVAMTVIVVLFGSGPENSNSKEELEEVIVEVEPGLQSIANQDPWGGAHAARPVVVEKPVIDEEKEALRRSLEVMEAEVAMLSKPLKENVSSAMARVEIKEGETLVMGGYPVGELNHEFAFITLTKIEGAVGEESVKVVAQMAEFGPDFIMDQGMESLATNAKNTLQHAEAWMNDDANQVIEAASQVEDSGIVQAPTIVAEYGQRSIIELGATEEGGLSLSVSVEPSGADGFSIESRIERGDQPPVQPWEVP